MGNKQIKKAEIQPKQIDMKQEVNVKLTVEEYNYILSQLGKQPFLEVSGLFMKIDSQIQSQLK